MKILEVAPQHRPVRLGRMVADANLHAPSCGCGGCTGRAWTQLKFRDFAGQFLSEAAVDRLAAGGPQILNEMTYRDLVGGIDQDFLDQGRRALELRVINLNNKTPFDPNEPDTMLFDAVSSIYEENNWTIYECRIKFMEWGQVLNDRELTPTEAARLLLWTGNIKLHCTDPSFLYWGYQYILTQLDAAIYPEDRFPEIRNPGLRGVVCKHMNRVLHALPFHLGDIAKEIKRQRAEIDIG